MEIEIDTLLVKTGRTFKPEFVLDEPFSSILDNGLCIDPYVDSFFGTVLVDSGRLLVGMGVM